jgi:Immunity protein 63
LEPLTLPQIKAEVDRRAAILGVTRNQELPTYGNSEDGARPHIEVDSRGYHFVVEERGRELKRVTTPDLDEILYQVFRGVTQSLAQGHRVRGEDPRREMFRRQLELLAKLNPQWAEREAERHRQILQDNPFVDKA